MEICSTSSIGKLNSWVIESNVGIEEDCRTLVGRVHDWGISVHGAALAGGGGKFPTPTL